MRKLMIIAGEASGDMHGASLIHELKKLDPQIKISGIGGDRMIAEGMQPLFHIKRMAFLGFIEVLRHLPFIRKVQNEILKKVKQESIDTVVLIDYPGFNLEMAGKLKQPGKKIIYYISPQVWAWGKGRIKKIKELIDKMIVVFPFEEELYKVNGVDAVYVGHPLVEQISGYQFLKKEELYTKLKLKEGKEILLVMPGSRKHEIKKLFPVSIQAAKRLADEFDLQIVVACAENIDEHVFEGLSEIKDFKLIKGNRYDLLKYSKFGIIKSGTSTLEAGIFELPFVVVYSTNALTYHLGKMLVKINNIAMANIILGETVVTELIQKDVNVDRIYEVSKEVLSDNLKYENIKAKLGSIKSKLGSVGASKRAAELIFSKLNEA